MTRSLIFQTSPVILKPFPAVASCGLLSQPLEAHQSSGLDLKHLGGLELQIRVRMFIWFSDPIYQSAYFFREIGSLLVFPILICTYKAWKLKTETLILY